MKGRIRLLAFRQVALALVLALALAGVSQQALAAVGTWTTKTPMPDPHYAAAAGAIGGKLYVAGGYKYTPEGNQCIDKSLLVYDPGTDTWDKKADMPTGSYAAAAGVINDILYVVGGNDPQGPTDRVLAYDPKFNTWTTKTPVPITTNNAAAGVINGKLYLADYGTRLYIYDPSVSNDPNYPGGGSWVEKMLPFGQIIPDAAAAGVLAVAEKQYLYPVGGWSPSYPGMNRVDAYDPETDTWYAKAPMPTGRNFLGVGVINGRLYAVGGFDAAGINSLATVEAYDPGSDTWSPDASMSTPRGWAAAAVLGNNLYTVGGEYFYDDGWYVDFLSSMEVFTPPGTGPLPVTIDIKPGESPNSINLGSNGKVPVAIFSTAEFDATQVDPLTVTLAGAHVALKGKGTTMSSWQDVDGDGRLDLVVQVDTQSFQLSVEDTEAVLEGKTYADSIYKGKAIRGTDTVRIVP